MKKIQIAKQIGILSAVLCFGSLAAKANASFEVVGKLSSITESQYVMEAEHFTYFISKSAISDDRAKSLKVSNKVISLYVPMEAIQRVKSHFNVKHDKKKS